MEWSISAKNKGKMMPLEYAAKEIRSQNAQTPTRKVYPLHENNGNQENRKTETRQKNICAKIKRPWWYIIRLCEAFIST